MTQKLFTFYSLLFVVCNFSSFYNAQGFQYGELCASTEDCSDHRYACVATAANASKRCLCDRFHAWGGKETGCVQIYNATEIMKMSINKTKTIDVDKEINAIVRGQFGAGIFVFAVVIFAVVVVIMYSIITHFNDRQAAFYIKNKTKGVVNEAGMKESSGKLQFLMQDVNQR